METGQKKISKNKKKRMAKRTKYISLKNIQNERRKIVIQSLIEHNRNEGQLISQLSSSKNLGFKRKKSPLKLNTPTYNNKQNKEHNDIDIDYENELSLSHSLSSSSLNEIKEKEDIKQNEVKAMTNELKELDPNVEKEIITKIHEIRERERLTEEIEEMKGIIYEEGTILLPKESDLILPIRKEKINESRKQLPVIRQEHDIMYAIDNSLVTIICGETGSGKSTQIPQFIYEKGYTKTIGKIAITQPRRVAARALAQRVADELNVKLGQEVGYQIRYESNYISQRTVIKFCTDGILLKELESDQLLSGYSVIIIDEAHERTINTDLLIGFLSQIIKIRYALWKKESSYVNGKRVLPLRLVIMSATLRVDEFTQSKIFKPKIEPRVVEVSSRQFPVSIYYSKQTYEDYISEAFKLCCKIHRRLPEGNVIVFLTGKREIMDLCYKLTQEFTKEHNDNYHNKTSDSKHSNQVLSNTNNEEKQQQHTIPLEEEERILNEIDNNQHDESPEFNYKPVIVLPLYSSMSPEDQMKIYQDYLSKRMMVIATNVAETSLTIPNVRYVVDSGRVKKKMYKSGLSFSTFSIQWVSQASANQRSGRAGRTCAGFCYRLYSNGLYVKMDKYSEPQIASCPLNQVFLMLKSMNVTNIQSFPFISQPNKLFIDKAIDHLSVIGALDSNEDENSLRMTNISKLITDNANNDNELNGQNGSMDSTKINDLGRLMIKFPIEPKLSKMLIMANSFSLIEYMIIIVSFLSIENPFDFNISYKELIEIYKSLQVINETSDIITYLNLVIITFKSKQTLIQINKRKLDEITNLSNQLCSICSKLFNKSIIINYSSLPIPTNEHQGLIMQIFLCGFIDSIARKKTLYDSQGNQLNNIKDQILKKKIVYEANDTNFECKMHPLSVLNGNLPEYIIYKEIIKDQKTYLICNSAIKPEWLYNIGGSLVKQSIAHEYKEPFYNKKTDSLYCYADIIYGYKQWAIPHVVVEMKKDDFNYYRYMARFILEGEIIEAMKDFKTKLNDNPNIITNKFSDMYLKVNRLVNSLKSNEINTKERLVQKLRNEKNYLKDIVLMWFDDIYTRNQLKINWPFVK